MRRTISYLGSQKISIWQSAAWLVLAGVFGLACLLSIIATQMLHALIDGLDIAGLSGTMVVMLGTTVWMFFGEKE